MDPLVPDVINLIDDEYVLSVDGNDEDANVSGDLDVRKAVDIIGAGSLETTITASGFDPAEKDRVIDGVGFAGAGFPQFPGLTLSGLSIRDGDVRAIPQGGGGISSTGFILTLDDVIVTENFAIQGGGIVSVQNVLVALNSQILSNHGGDSGGGIFSALAVLVMDSSTVAGNTSNGSGGGVFSGSTAVITNSTISGNQALPLPNGINIQGSSGFGGGIVDTFNNLLVINSTISGNTTLLGGGGIAFLNFGAGAAVEGAGFTPSPGLFNVTIARNVVTNPNFGKGGGICNFCTSVVPQEVDGAGIVFPIANTLIAENQAMAQPDCFGIFLGGFFSDGFNLLGDIGDPAECPGFVNGSNGDKVGGNGNPVINPMITDLQDNGGPTETHGLLAGSPAIDMGDPAGCMAPTIPPDIMDLLNNGTGPLAELLRDQRNFPRPVDGDEDGTPICDIGAFEFQIFSFELAKTDDTGGNSVPVGDTFAYTITVTNNGPGMASNVTLDDPLPTNVDLVSVSPSQGSCTGIGDVISCDLGDLAVGESATVTVTVLAVTAGTFTNTVTLSLTNPSQQTLTETAQVTTTISSGLFVFGSGNAFNCGLHPGAPAVGVLKGSMVLLLVLLFSAGCLTMLRRRGN
jgi:uncharacterized repeat protein (TIGR01451 family)